MIRHEPVVESFPRVGRVRSLVDKPTPVNRPDVRQNGPVLIVTDIVGVAAVAVIVLCVRPVLESKLGFAMVVSVVLLNNFL